MLPACRFATLSALQTAITMHHSPRVTLAAGPVAYLLSAGAGVDVAGLRCWELPRALLADAVRDHPREGFKGFFRRAWANEAARVPGGGARLLRRYGAFTGAICRGDRLVSSTGPPTGPSRTMCKASAGSGGSRRVADFDVVH
jgi:hypothetical protein